MNMLQPLFSLFSPAGRHARLSVFIFHRVLLAPDPIFPEEMHAQRFKEVCGWLRSWFNALPLDLAVSHLKAGTLPARSACITFDDGYADNYDVALPILQQHGLPATFFIATNFLDGGCMWNDRVIESIRLTKSRKLDLGHLGHFTIQTPAEKAAAIGAIISKIKYLPVDQRVAVTQHAATAAQVDPPGDLMMTSTQVKAIRHMGMQVGAHTLSHPILARLTEVEARAEIKGSKDYLESLLGERVGLFAYPNGKPGQDYTPTSVEVVRSLGFDAAVSTQGGASRMGDDLFQIKRFTPWDRSRMKFGARLLANLYSS